MFGRELEYTEKKEMRNVQRFLVLPLLVVYLNYENLMINPLNNIFGTQWHLYLTGTVFLISVTYSLLLTALAILSFLYVFPSFHLMLLF